MYFAVGRIDPEESRMKRSPPVISKLVDPRSTAHRLDVKYLVWIHGFLEFFYIQQLALLYSSRIITLQI